MRVGFFTDTFQPSLNGVVTSIDSFATELARLGCEVTVFAPRAPGAGLSASTLTTSAQVHWLPSFPLVFEPSHRIALPVVRRAIKIAKQERLDIIHTQTPFGIGYAGMRVARAVGVPLVHTYHTYYAEYAHYLRAGAQVGRRLVGPMSRWVCNLHDLVLAPSTDIRELLRRYGVRKPIEILMSGVRLPDLGSPRAARATTESGRELLFVGRLAREKNLDLLIDAMIPLLRLEPTAKLRLVGDGPDRARLEHLVREAGLNSRVQFAGWVRHDLLAPWFERAEVFVFPSMTETQGLALLEAMSFALPAVAVAGPGTRDLVEHGRNGLLVGARAGVLADAVYSLLDDPDLSSKLGKAARRTAQSLNMEAQARRLLGHYQQLHAACGRTARRGLRGLAATAWEEAVAWK